jgi:putative membrane protein
MGMASHSLMLGVPVLLIHLAVTTALFIAGVSLYVYIAPYRELELIREGNIAAAVVLSGQTLGIAIPLAAMMANSITAPGIVIWGVVTIVLQYVAILSVRLSVRGLCGCVARGEVAVAMVLAVAQLSAGLLIAAAMTA